MNSKLRIRIGEVEIDYEGTEEFLKQELPQLLKTAMELHKAAGATPANEADGKSNPADETGGAKNGLSFTTGGIAAKIEAKSGSDLLLAAAGHLVLMNKTEPFSRAQLLTEMKDAKAYYKKSYSGNLSGYLKTALRDGSLAETATDSFTLTARARKDLEKKLADG